MKADRALWIDETGRLVKSPPASGFKIAAAKGSEISFRMVEKYELELVDGKVTQKWEEPVVEEKKKERPEDKAVKAPENKGGGLTIETADQTRTSKRGRPKKEE